MAGVVGTSFVLGASLGGGTVQGAAAEPASTASGMVFEEPDKALLADYDPETARWELDPTMQVAPEVTAWLDRHLGPVDNPAGPQDQVTVPRGRLWRVILPDDLELYVQEEGWAGTMTGRLYFLRDSVTGALSPEPFEKDARWRSLPLSDRSVRIHLAQLDPLAPWQIAIRDSGHNGTLYNGQQIHFLEPVVEQGIPRLVGVLSMDIAVQWPFGVRDGCAPGGIFASTLIRDADGLRFEHWYEHAGLGVARRPAARGRYVRSAAGEPFELTGLEILDRCSPLPR